MAVNIFFCYAHEDETLLKKLKAHLRPLQRQGLITVWYDRDISAGTEWEQQIKEQLNSAQIILLLVSPDFMDSDYCYGIEMQRALQRHQRGEARVIPIILRPVYWQGEPLGKLQALPTDGKPVMSALWHSVDEAFFDVTQGIRTVVTQLGQKPVSPSEVLPSPASKDESADVSLTILTPQPAKPASIDKSDEFTLIRTFEGNSGVVWSVALDAKGTMLASGNDDTTIDIWDINRNELDSTLMGYTKGFNETPIAEFGEIDIRQLDDTFRGHKEAVNCLAFSPTESLLVSGSDDKTIKVWELYTSPGLERTLEGHKEAVNCLAFSSNGQIIVSGSDDKRIKVCT
jgi:hypothetical protein